MRRIVVGAACGVLAAGLGFAVAHLVAAATRPRAAPLVSVGGAVIDAAPTPLKEFAVRQFGTNDKPVLLATVVIVSAVLAALAGIAGLRRRRAVVIAVPVLLGAAGAAAALSRPAAGWLDAVPALAGAVPAGAALWWLLRRATSGPVESRATSGPVESRTASGPVEDLRQPGPRPIERPTEPPPRPSTERQSVGRTVDKLDRRGFLQAAALVTGAAAAAGAGAGALGAVRTRNAATTRDAVRLPAPADPAAPLPAGGRTGFFTANADFYRVDTALTVPRLDLADWSLRVRGRVERELRFGFADLLERPLIERDVTLNCVSGEVGNPYVGTARWLGVPLGPLLREAGVDRGADQLVARGADGMTIGTPLDAVLASDAMLVLGMNGEPLPLIHGFPVRMLTPGLYGYAGACKWLTELEVTTFADFDAYWVQRGWDRRGTVRTASRIDRPAPFGRLSPGPATIAGVAWAQGRGIRAVQVRVDAGGWMDAEVLPGPSPDTWVQWRCSWTATPGLHQLAVRATDGDGVQQPEERVTPFPAGATGWHTVTVTVG